MPRGKGLTDKQAAFAREYVIDFNASAAAEKLPVRAAASKARKAESGESRRRLKIGRAHV